MVDAPTAHSALGGIRACGFLRTTATKTTTTTMTITTTKTAIITTKFITTSTTTLKATTRDQNININNKKKQQQQNMAVYTAYVAPRRPKSKSITDIRTDGPTDGHTLL